MWQIPGFTCCSEHDDLILRIKFRVKEVPAKSVSVPVNCAINASPWTHNLQARNLHGLQHVRLTVAINITISTFTGTVTDTEEVSAFQYPLCKEYGVRSSNILDIKSWFH